LKIVRLGIGIFPPRYLATSLLLSDWTGSDQILERYGNYYVLCVTQCYYIHPESKLDNLLATELKTNTLDPSKYNIVTTVLQYIVLLICQTPNVDCITLDSFSYAQSTGRICHIVRGCHANAVCYFLLSHITVCAESFVLVKDISKYKKLRQRFL